MGCASCAVWDHMILVGYRSDFNDFEDPWREWAMGSYWHLYVLQ